MRRFGVLAALAAAAVLLVLPGHASAAGMIGSLSVNPSQVRDGAPATGTVHLVAASGSPTTVLLFSSDTSVATVPATITVPAGAASADFTISTNAAAPPTIVQLMAAVDNIPRTANLSVNAATPSGPSLSTVSATPSTIAGGGAATGTVRFTGATDGAVVQLSSSNPAVLQVPSETVVPGRGSTGTFAITTSAVTTSTPVTITASWFGVTRTTTVTVTPAAPPKADKVTIKQARWSRGLLSIEASSTNANAILSVFGADGEFMFNLTNQGGGKFSDQRGWVFDPLTITVRSNFGGSATAHTSK